MAAVTTSTSLSWISTEGWALLLRIEGGAWCVRMQHHAAGSLCYFIFLLQGAPKLFIQIYTQQKYSTVIL